MKKHRITKLTLLLLSLVMLMGSTSVFAGNYCTIVKGSGAASKSFYIKATSSRDYFYFTQVKGTMKHTKGYTNSNMTKYKNTAINGYYYVWIYDCTTKKETDKKITDSNKKIKLKKGHTYKITIQPGRLTNVSVTAHYIKKLNGYPIKWTKYSSWTVTIP